MPLSRLFKKYTFLHLTFWLAILSPLSCKKGPQEQKTVYLNDFETRDLKNISGGIFTSYNNTTVLGRYNKGGFQLRLDALPAHNLIEVSFDLYIHDSWDGNDASPDGPDIWKLEIEGARYIHTSFSNKECPFTCFPQSYPFNYLNSNQSPRSGAFLTQLPGFCFWADRPRGSSMYKIVKRIKHSAASFSMRCSDELKQDNIGDELCDESWSVDNLTVKSIKID